MLKIRGASPYGLRFCSTVNETTSSSVCSRLQHGTILNQPNSRHAGLCSWSRYPWSPRSPDPAPRFRENRTQRSAPRWSSVPCQTEPPRLPGPACDVDPADIEVSASPPPVRKTPHARTASPATAAATVAAPRSSPTRATPPTSAAARRARRRPPPRGWRRRASRGSARRGTSRRRARCRGAAAICSFVKSRRRSSSTSRSRSVSSSGSRLRIARAFSHRSPSRHYPKKWVKLRGRTGTTRSEACDVISSSGGGLGRVGVGSQRCQKSNVPPPGLVGASRYVTTISGHSRRQPS